MTPPATPSRPVDLAARLAGRLCHDFISPTSAIVSALDLIEDPEQQDMREEAMAVVVTSARKLAALLTFARAAFGGAAATESFDVRELERLTRDVYEHARAELDWAVTPASLPKPAARALLNLAQLGIAALPMGGVARLSVASPQGGDAGACPWRPTGARARLRPEAVRGLHGRGVRRGPGRPMGPGLLPARPRRPRPAGGCVTSTRSRTTPCGSTAAHARPVRKGPPNKTPAHTAP